jgi:hypothetical protein
MCFYVLSTCPNISKNVFKVSGTIVAHVGQFGLKPQNLICLTALISVHQYKKPINLAMNLLISAGKLNRVVCFVIALLP